MFKNHLKFALRILWKDGIYSMLNILGLTLGITVGIILLLYLQSELNYDSHHEKSDQIFRVTHHLKAQGADFNTARTSRELGGKLKEEFPEVINYVRFNQYNTTLVTVDLESPSPQKFLEEKNVVVSDTSLLSIFTHQIIAGNAVGCLEGPGKVVLTATIAEKYFGEASAVGKTILVDDEKRLVTAVISDLPDNSHLKYEIILSDLQSRDWAENAKKEGNLTRVSEAYWNPGVYTYLLMKKGYKPESFKASFEIIFDKYFSVFAEKIGGSADPLLQPLTEIHFGKDLDSDEARGNINYVYTFTAIGFFLILLACINYMNMATARSVYRAGEIGVRKVLGNTRLNLFWSLLMEALLLAVFAMILSVVLSFIVLNFTPFNAWIDKDLSLNFISNPTLIFGVLGITFLVGVISGLYPALYIPSMPVVTALKGSFKSQSGGILLRKILIVIQFAVSIFVIITTVLMDKQISYMQKVDLGFQKENVVVVNVQDDEVMNKIPAIKQELKANPNILAASTSFGVPGLGLGGQVFKVEQEDGMIQKSTFTIFSGEDYLETIGYEIVKGRDFLPGQTDIAKSIIINEAAAKELGWGENALEKRVRFFHGEDDMKVVGVVKDFNFESLHNEVSPLFILPSRDNGGKLQVRISGKNIQESIAHIKVVMEEFDTKNPFEYVFLDREFNKQYKADEIQHKLISALSYICIFISILGLIGLSAFSVGQKTKEISIRKTLGGSTGHVLYLFSKDYIKLILIAIVIAIPLADFVIVDWLSAFAYQMPQEWLYYIIPSFLVLLFGFATVLLQVMKTAKANPVNGLRSE